LQIFWSKFLILNIKHLNNNVIHAVFFKHFAKASQANTLKKALSKSLQSQRSERNCFKKICRHLKKIKKR